MIIQKQELAVTQIAPLIFSVLKRPKSIFIQIEFFVFFQSLRHSLRHKLSFYVYIIHFLSQKNIQN